MCGIAGIMTLNGEPPSPATLEAMSASLRHRGPDGSGDYLSDDVGIVQTRLAVIDPETGNQPFRDLGGTALVANGEIYNYLELRNVLNGSKFATRSDCELPLHLYHQYGLGFTGHLRGMYALALHDANAGRLILARDPFGIKPLYYAETAAGFAFASEARALIAAQLVEPRLVHQTRNELLQLQFTTGAETIFAGIQRLLPGETIVVTKGRIVERYRQTPLPIGAPDPLSESEGLALLDEELEDSVELHLRSDVPCGIFLSGGIDSAVVLALMVRFTGDPIRAFTATFPNSSVPDESERARVLAASVGAEHILVEFTETEFWQLLPEVAAVLDDPVADYAALPTYKLARSAKESGVKVILSSEGGDELFGGYGRYRSAMRPWWAGGRKARSRGHLEGLGLLRNDLAGWRNGMNAAEQNAKNNGWTRLQAAQAADCADWLPNDVLTKLDRCLMAHGVEGRTPLLDVQIADFAFRLPDKLKIQNGLGKWLLRCWLMDRLPVAEPFAKKRGFTVPVAEWIARCGSKLGPLVAAQPGIQEICLPEAVEKLFARANGKHEGFAAWTLLFYALWHRHHILKLPRAPDVFSALATMH